jgi:hypothetical protein
MSAEYLTLAFFVLLGRALAASDERAMSLGRFALSLAVPVLSLVVMRMSPALALVAGGFAVASACAFALDRGDRSRNLVRFAASLALLAGLSFIGPRESSTVRFAAWATRAAAAVSGASVLLAGMDGRAFASALAVLSGALFVSTEVNHLARYVLVRIKVAPAATGAAQARGEAELRRGKIIGIVERLLIYYFVLTSSLSAIGFVLAAKGFTRFRELDDRNFAEYVLIGTLLSAAGAILVGMAVRLVLAAL